MWQTVKSTATKLSRNHHDRIKVCEVGLEYGVWDSVYSV